MASSGNKTVTVTAYDTLKFSWSQTSQSIEKNSTVVAWKLELIAAAYGLISASASYPWSVTVNGTSYSGSVNVAIGNNATKTLASGSTTITHSADGTKTFNYSFSQSFDGIYFSGVNIGVKSGSGSGTLNTIPRATTPTLSASSANMGVDSVTINTAGASTSFTHDLAYKFAGSSWVSIATGVKTSYKWTVPDLCTSVPSATSGTMTIRCITKNGSTEIGTKTVLLTAKVPTTVVPSISSVALEETVSGLADQFGGYVQNKSKVKATITAAGAKGSTIKTYSTTFMGKTYSGSSWTSGLLADSGTLSMTTTVTDSRGRTAKKTTSLTVLTYIIPQIYSLTVARCLEDGTLDPNGTYAKVAFNYAVAPVNGKNTATVTIDFKRATASSYATADVIYTGTDLSKNGTVQSSQTFTTDYSFDIRLKVTDWFGASGVYVTSLPSGAVILDISADGKGIAFFQTSEREGVTIAGQLPGSPWEIKTGTDLDGIMTPGIYTVPTVAIAGSLSNAPPNTATATGSLSVISAGTPGQLIQSYRKGTKTDGAIYERHYYSSAWGDWVRVFAGAGSILWEKAWFMNETQTAELYEPISRQQSGVVLVFSRYSSSTAQDYHWNHFFVPKAFVASHSGQGSQFLMTTDATFSVIASKYLYISDTTIKGNANNVASGTANGITYNNAGFVMRYVIGV